MCKGRRALAIIPARKGSKRLPEKNTRMLAGKPLIQWTIDAARESALIDELLVTSDDPAVLQLAVEQGVEHIINRPPELASDTATTADAILHAIRTLETRTALPTDICLLQATSPLRSADDIDGAMRRYRRSKAAAVISVCKLEHPLAWCAPLDENGKMTYFAERVKAVKRSQDASPYYRLNGAVFITSLTRFIEQKDFFSKDAVAYVMPEERSVDIDRQMDFVVAECLQVNLHD